MQIAAAGQGWAGTVGAETEWGQRMYNHCSLWTAVDVDTHWVGRLKAMYKLQLTFMAVLLRAAAFSSKSRM